MTRPKPPPFADQLAYHIARLYGAGEKAMIKAGELLGRTSRTLYRWTTSKTAPPKEVQAAVLEKLRAAMEERAKEARKERPLQEGEGK